MAFKALALLCLVYLTLAQASGPLGGKQQSDDAAEEVTAMPTSRGSASLQRHRDKFESWKHNVSIEEQWAEDLSGDKTWTERLTNEIIFEVSAQNGPPPVKSKLIFAICECFFICACLGFDRCYMGQCCCGILKALTFGGFGIWVLVDYFIFLCNSLGQYKTIDTLGFVAKWDDETVGPAFCVAFFMVALWCGSVCCTPIVIHQKGGSQNDDVYEAFPADEKDD